MGQLYVIANLTKHEYFQPCNKFNSIIWHGYSNALAYLIASGYGNGIDEDVRFKALIGRWSGDKIAIIGDYSSEFKIPRGSLRKLLRRMYKNDIIGPYDKETLFYWYVWFYYKDITKPIERLIGVMPK